MYTDDEIKQIIYKNELSDVECLGVIRRYIYDKKNIDVGYIKRPIGNTQIINMTFKTDFELMNDAYNIALNYYNEKLRS